MYRKIISLTILFVFLIVFTTGILSYLTEYTETIAVIHTIFGFVLGIGIILHIVNNFRPLRMYSQSKAFLLLMFLVVLSFFGTYYQFEVVDMIMNYGRRSKATSGSEVNPSMYEIMDMNLDQNTHLSIDLLRGEHYWHPQMVIWIEDMDSNYIETIYISKATSKGMFFGGRSKENFKTFDEEKDAEGDYRRVDALPVWSHKRGIVYSDGLYTPMHSDPMPDAITGATFIDNFKLASSTDERTRFNIFIELNVAFDDNEFYSEYDFPDDEVFHNGTGQLGQPSIIYSVAIDMFDGNDYYLAHLIGHGHRSGQSGKIYSDMSNLTTAHDIVERIVIGVKSKDK